MTVDLTRYCARITAALVVVLVLICGCTSDKTESPIINEDIPVTNIADLPDIEQTRTQLLELIERVRAEVVRVVPDTEPWEWRRDEARFGCVQEATGSEGSSLHLRNLVSDRPLTDDEWNRVFPAVERIAVEAGLTNYSAPQNSSGNHDVRFTSDDGRELVFGTREATLISGSAACRRRSGDAAGAHP